MLTIGILTSDKDISLLQNLLQSISFNIKCDKEVIIFNNCTEMTLQIEGATVLNNGGGNLRQLTGRSEIIKHANGDYIWFIDADDDICNLQFEPDGFDVYDCSYTKVQDGIESTVTNQPLEVTVENNLLQDNVFYGITSVWNKIIKTSILREVEKNIDDTLEVSAYEDTILCYGAMYLAKSYKSMPDCIYKYNIDNSSAMITDYTDHYDAFERCTYGIGNVVQLLNAVTNNTLSDYLGKSVESFVFGDYVGKIAHTTDKDTQDKMYVLICSLISNTGNLNTPFWECLNEFSDKDKFDQFVSVSSKYFDTAKTTLTPIYEVNDNNERVVKEISKTVEYPDYYTMKGICTNLYTDDDPDGNPFTLNCNNGEIEIFTPLENEHYFSTENKLKNPIGRYNTEQFVFHFSFSSACNLHCSYCFADKETATVLSLERTQKVIDSVFEKYGGKINNIVISNTGEPFYDSEAFWEVYDYVLSKGMQRWEVLLNTNGTNFTDDDVERIIEKGGINISIDGQKEIQDAHRGEGTYDAIVKNMPKFTAAKSCMCATVVLMDDDIPIMDIVDHLYSIGFTGGIFIGPCRIDGYWTDERKERLYARYEEMWKSLMNRICYEKQLYLISLLFLRFGTIQGGAPSTCAMLEPNFYALDCDGNAYKCYEDVGRTEKSVGNIMSSDMDSIISEYNKKMNAYNYIHEDCVDCPFALFCGSKNNMCLHQDSELLCKLEHLKWKYMLKIYAYILNNYLPEEQQFVFSDPRGRAEQLDKNPELYNIDPIFYKDWYYSDNVQKAFSSGKLDINNYHVPFTE